MPNFRNTYDALVYGRNSSQEVIEYLRVCRAKLLIIGDLLRRENEINWAIQCICQAQFMRESIEAWERRI